MCSMTPHQYNEMREEFETITAEIKERKEKFLAEYTKQLQRRINEACRNDRSHTEALSK